MKQRNTIINCSYSTCSRGDLCPNFSSRPSKHSFNFPSCPYNPIHLLVTKADTSYNSKTNSNSNYNSNFDKDTYANK